MPLTVCPPFGVPMRGAAAGELACFQVGCKGAYGLVNESRDAFRHVTFSKVIQDPYGWFTLYAGADASHLQTGGVIGWQLIKAGNPP